MYREIPVHKDKRGPSTTWASEICSKSSRLTGTSSGFQALQSEALNLVETGRTRLRGIDQTPLLSILELLAPKDGSLSWIHATPSEGGRRSQNEDCDRGINPDRTPDLPGLETGPDGFVTAVSSPMPGMCPMTPH
ncbi:hypothetical protein GMRT_20192 [Giardia muris]|uniref:Uncharacterized protein n=1 Tax=Giardia muris TaxID=5742 RepID=A0A4Z1TA57_GIAMU|nr:hypothetical protein GMRT_24760 [Giardia muris]TNJ29411.1 hypothetical protein GMRT_20192 [Giardia muris]|eukprot:TNJ26466.1 hypothetical protein GMRT_24760 [Giardia muris]